MNRLALALALVFAPATVRADPPRTVPFLDCRAEHGRRLTLAIDVGASTPQRLVLAGRFLSARIRIEVDQVRGDAGMGTSCEVFHVIATTPASAVAEGALTSLGVCHHHPPPGRPVRTWFVFLQNRVGDNLPQGRFDTCRAPGIERAGRMLGGVRGG